MCLLLLKYYFKLFKKMKMLVNKNFIYYFLKIIITYFLFIFLIKLIWHFNVKCGKIKIRRGIFKNIIFRY